MTYCQAGQKPIIKYKFGQSAERIFNSRYSPIDVSVKSVPLGGTDNSNPDGYGLGFIPGNGNGSYYWFTVTDHQIFEIPRSVPDPYGWTPRIALKECGQADFTRISSASCAGLNLYTNCLQTRFLSSELTIDTNRKCPTSDKQRCSLEVSYKGLIIFQAQGDCPCTFSVQCGDCAEDEIKCEKPGYPGYCCIKCSEIVGEIKSITSAVRAANYG